MERDHDPGAVDDPQTRACSVLPALTTGSSTASAPSRGQEQQTQQQQDSHVQQLSAAEEVTANQPVSLCSLPDPLVQHVLHMLDHHSRDQAMASCKQVGRLMLTTFHNVCYKLEGRHSWQIGSALGTRIQWVLENCKCLHLVMDNTPLCSPLASLTSAMPGGCLPSVTKLTLMFTKLDGLLPAYLIEALPNLKFVDYHRCRFNPELEPVCTSPAVKLLHLGLNLERYWGAKEWSAAQKQQLQDICQLRSITSLGIPLHGPTAACLSQLTSQLTAVTFYVDNDWQDASAWHVVASCASLQQFAAKFSAGWRYKIGVPVQQAVQTPGLSAVEICGRPITSKEMLQLLSLPHLTTLEIHSVSEDLPSTWPCSKLQQLRMWRATLQQLAGAPLQQLTAPLKLKMLVISRHALQEQLLWATAAAQRLRAGPGYCVSWDTYTPQYMPREYCPYSEVVRMANAPPAASIARILEACIGLLPSEHHTPSYILYNLNMSVSVVQALKQCLSVQSHGLGALLHLSFDDCILQPGALAALAVAFPYLKHLTFNTLPNMQELKGYLWAQQQQRQLVQTAHKQDISFRLDVSIEFMCYTKYVEQLKGYLKDNSIEWFTVEGCVMLSCRSNEDALY